MVRKRKVCNLKLRRHIANFFYLFFIKEMKAGRRQPQNNDQRAVSLIELLEEKKKHTLQDKRLENMTWGMGLEHETQFFYTPITARESIYPVDEIVIMMTQIPAQELLEYNYDIKESDKELLEKIDFETTGRKCAGVTVLDQLKFNYAGKQEPLRMPEFITDNPFSTLKNKKTILNYCKQLIEKEIRYKHLIENIPYIRNFLNKYELNMNEYPFGMCSNLRIRKDYTTESPDLEKNHYQDYTGSYHFTITLPFEKKEKYTQKDEKDFVEMHYNFGAMFQWIEPLLLAAYFSCDQKAVGTKEKRIRGSFRVARVGWGNFAGSDMRKRNEEVGVGRYADVEPYWRKNFKFHESDLTKHCEEPHWQEDQAISSFSSNIRTFGPDPSQPENPKARISGAKMTIPNGMEIRIFDHFLTLNLYSLLQIIILVAANSRTTKVKEYVYEDEDWKKTIQKIMLEGWKAEISPVFIKKIENIYEIELQPKYMKAFDILEEITLRLFEKNKNSDIVYLMYGKVVLPRIPMVNKYSWDLAFMIKLFEDKKVFGKYLKFVEAIIQKNKVSDFKKCVIKYFGKNWTDNWLDILYFMEGKNLIGLLKNGEEFEIVPKNMKAFLSRDAIETEIIIQLNIIKTLAQGVESNNANPLDQSNFFSKAQITKRYKKLLDMDSEFFIKVAKEL